MPTALSLVETTGALMFGTLDGHIFAQSRAVAHKGGRTYIRHSMIQYSVYASYSTDMRHIS